MPTTAFAVNPQLTAIAMAYRNQAISFIADEVLPRVQTAKKFNYSVYDVGQGYSVPNTLVGRASEPAQVDFTGTAITDEVLDYGLDDLLPLDEVEAFASMPKPASGGPMSPQEASTMYLQGLILLDREVRVAARVFNTASYAGTNVATLSGTSQWSDYVNSNPLAVIPDAEGLDGASLAAAATTDAVKARLRANTDEVIARGGYGSPTIFVDRTDMYFGNDQLPLVEAALRKWPTMVFFALVLVATIGQGSMVETFAHMRTPVYMSFMRGIGGIVLGAGIGAVAMILVELWQAVMARARKANAAEKKESKAD